MHGRLQAVNVLLDAGQNGLKRHLACVVQAAGFLVFGCVQGAGVCIGQGKGGIAGDVRVIARLVPAAGAPLEQGFTWGEATAAGPAP